MVRTVSIPFEKLSHAPVTYASAVPARVIEPCALLKAVNAAPLGVLRRRRCQSIQGDFEQHCPAFSF
jgi:hypothetical protein